MTKPNAESSENVLHTLELESYNKILVSWQVLCYLTQHPHFRNFYKNIQRAHCFASILML